MGTMMVLMNERMIWERLKVGRRDGMRLPQARGRVFMRT
jgi:hypothetical protein